jgi:small subunit ribosomal protein S6
VKLYETCFIVNPQTDEAAIEKSVKSVVDLITNRGGKIVVDDRMGTRRMTYAIDGLTQGYYTSLIFEAPPTLNAELERHYRLDESYIRHITILYDGDPEQVRAARELLQQSMDRADQAAADARREMRESREGGGFRGGRGGGGGGRYRDDDDYRPRGGGRGRHD